MSRGSRFFQTLIHTFSVTGFKGFGSIPVFDHLQMFPVAVVGAFMIAIHFFFGNVITHDHSLLRIKGFNVSEPLYSLRLR